MILNFLLNFLIGVFIGVCLQDYVIKKIKKRNKEDEWSNNTIRVMGYNYCNPNSRNSMWGAKIKRGAKKCVKNNNILNNWNSSAYYKY